MAELVLGIVPIVVSLLQQIGKLKIRFQQAKATKGEFRELQDFLRSIQDCYEKYHTGGTETTTATTTTTLTTTATTPRSPFAEALNDVQKKLEKWSSQNCSFFSRSSAADRVKKLQALHRKLQDAIQVEHFRMTFCIYKYCVRNNDGQTEISQSQNLTIEASTAIDDPHGHNTSATLTSFQVTTPTTTIDDVESSSQVTTITTTTDQVSTHLERSNNTSRPSFTRSRSKSVERYRHSTIPSNPPIFTRSRSKSVERYGPSTIPSNPPTFTRSRSKSVERCGPSTIPSNPPTFTRSRSKSVERYGPSTIPSNPPTFTRSRSKSVERCGPSTIPSNPPTFTRSRSKSVERCGPITIPSNPPTFTRSRSKSIQKDGHHSSEKGRTENLDSEKQPRVMEKRLKFWVPLGSEKQARDMEKRLKPLPGVKSVFYDLVKKKVWVEVGEGSNVDTDTLLEEIKCARSKYKLEEPKRWSDYRLNQPKASV